MSVVTDQESSGISSGPLKQIDAGVLNVGCVESGPSEGPLMPSCSHLDQVRHASAHARSVGHPLVRSLEPGETWSWCFVDELALVILAVRGETRIPPPADPPSDDFIMRNGGDAQQVGIGWWPGDPNHERAAFFALAYPAPDGFADADLSPAPGRWDAQLGEYVLDWEDVRASPDPHAAALEFAHSAFRHACAVCGWDPALAATAEGVPPPIR